MRSLKGTKTEKNLMLSFAGESQARNRYTFFASQARKEGYEQIAWAFAETADQEKEHAKLFFSLLQGGEVEITGAFPAGVIGTTRENLAHAADGEQHENTKVYPEFAGIAKAEGFPAVEELFNEVTVAEKGHEMRYRAFSKNIDQGLVFKRPNTVRWRCRNCGYIHEGTEAPVKCPCCEHPRAFFELLVENY